MRMKSRMVKRRGDEIVESKEHPYNGGKQQPKVYITW